MDPETVCASSTLIGDDDVEFDSVAKKCTELLKGKIISLVTDSQHLHQVDKVEKIFTEMELQLRLERAKDS